MPRFSRSARWNRWIRRWRRLRGSFSPGPENRTLSTQRSWRRRRNAGTSSSRPILRMSRSSPTALSASIANPFADASAERSNTSPRFYQTTVSLPLPDTRRSGEVSGTPCATAVPAISRSNGSRSIGSARASDKTPTSSGRILEQAANTVRTGAEARAVRAPPAARPRSGTRTGHRARRPLAQRASAGVGPGVRGSARSPCRSRWRRSSAGRTTSHVRVQAV